MTAAAEFFYKVPGKLGGIRPGAHSSSRLGQGQEFAAHARLFDSPDPRRLDLRASLRDVRGEWLVRTNRQRSSVRVQAVVDVSASMAFGARTRKLDVAADFVAALGYSAFRFGDSVGLCAFDQESRNDLYVPPSIGRGAGVLMADRLRQCAVRDSSMRNLQGLLELTEQASRSSLVFLLSDFHWPLSPLSQWLDALLPAHVVPVVIWDRAETEPPARGHLLAVRDAETGHRRTYWLRETVRDQWRSAVARRAEGIDALFAAHHGKPLYLRDGFDGEAVSRYFMENIA